MGAYSALFYRNTLTSRSESENLGFFFLALMPFVVVGGVMFLNMSHFLRPPFLYLENNSMSLKVRAKSETQNFLWEGKL